MRIRKTKYNNEWWYSVEDAVGMLTGSIDSAAYWCKLKDHLHNEGSKVVTNCHRLQLKASDGTLKEADAANTETLFRIIQSISSFDAEWYKQWLAKVGYAHLQEIHNPELIFERSHTPCKNRGNSKDNRKQPSDNTCNVESDLEFIFALLGKVAIDGDIVAGSAQKDLEKQLAVVCRQ